MMTQITDFLAGKNLSDNSKQAYAYDLRQFMELVSGQLDETSLKQYDNHLKEFKPSVQKRKRSAVNQFLAYLYQEGELDRLLKLDDKGLPQPQGAEPIYKELTELYQGPDNQGKLACLLMLELGLLPVEVLSLSWSALDLDFGVVTVAKGPSRRVLKLTTALNLLLKQCQDSTDDLVFSRQGQPYTRQWLYKQVRDYVKVCGYPELTAQTLRQQFIVREIKKGTGAFELARLLGLKSPVTLEKYYRT